MKTESTDQGEIQKRDFKCTPACETYATYGTSPVEAFSGAKLAIGTQRSPRLAARGILKAKKSTFKLSRSRPLFTSVNSPLEQAKAAFDIPRLWTVLGLPDQPSKCCKSPFRDERNPSFSVSTDGRLWHDFATDEGGDVIAFLAKAKGIGLSEAAKQLIALNDSGGANLARPVLPPRPQAKAEPQSLPALPSDLHSGTPEQLRTLARLRGMNPEGLALASKVGTLRFGTVRGLPAWLIVSSCGRNAQARRMDGQPWQNGIKAHTLRHAQASIPIGWERIEHCPFVAIVEGAPDLLAAYCLCYAEGRQDVAPVAMLGASNRIHTDTLLLFRGKSIRIYSHADKAGQEATARWAAQLRQAGASVIESIHFPQQWRTSEGNPVNDLNDFLHLDPDTWETLANRHCLPDATRNNPFS